MIPHFPRRLARDEDGGNAIETAIVLMVIVILTLGTTDLALAMWQWTVSEKATQRGARAAAVSDFVSPDLATYGGPTSTVDYGTSCWDTSGADGPVDICAPDDNPVTCTQATCSDGSTPNATAFTAIVSAMQDINPLIEPANVEVEYTFNGLGFVGRPGGMPVDVTVRLIGMTFDFIALDALVGLPGQIPMPPFTATLVGEDFNSSM